MVDEHLGSDLERILVVDVFPLLPVTQIIVAFVNCAANSISDTTGTPFIRN